MKRVFPAFAALREERLPAGQPGKHYKYHSIQMD